MVTLRLLVTYCSSVRGFSHEGRLTPLGNINGKFNALFFRQCQNVPTSGCASVRMGVSKYVPTKYLFRLKELLRINKVPNGSNEHIALSHTEGFLLFSVLF